MAEDGRDGKGHPSEVAVRVTHKHPGGVPEGKAGKREWRREKGDERKGGRGQVAIVIIPMVLIKWYKLP